MKPVCIIRDKNEWSAILKGMENRRANRYICRPLPVSADGTKCG